MTYSTENSDVRRRPASLLRWAWAGLGSALAWPGRVYEARQILLRLGRMNDHELRDIGLTRHDLADAGALDLAEDPSVMLRRRVGDRRRRP